ncbi:peptidase S13 [Arenibacter sp. H213]|uniref:D-alanyl-D-alanine carboxypeptidase n=1 Tax=Arenibacter antarcticus TaxID=2040469 RepID=A0ABW5VBZ9_9FLAO|nr:D-alanyl-D-alanine carboxypeptidase [Arenibacter sp. H213]MCM4169519.1 peptidase S13 [Arenibacter sp. H213]
MKHIFLLLSLCILFSSCVTSRLIKPIKNSEVFKQGFTGIVIYDPNKDKVLYAQNEDKYFIPASNTKMFTFYTAYKILGDTVNSLNYRETKDSLVFWGTGNPAFLHPDFNDVSALELLRSTNKKLYWADNSEEVTAYGSGWSWNWYKYYYGPQRTALPMYGNIVRFTKGAGDRDLSYSPHFFAKDIRLNKDMSTLKYTIDRDSDANLFQYNIVLDTVEIETDRPFATSSELTLEMLMDTLGKEVHKIEYKLVAGLPHTKLKGVETDSLFKQMMTISDNFLAEQLLVLASDKLFDSLNIGKVIEYAEKNYLSDLPDKPVWVDGSGLSSHNKFTPRSIIALLKKIREEIPEEKIYAFFPAGGKSGTIKSWYASGNAKPYIYAKTGTLDGTHCLSGYLLTKSNKMLYFSFMHNNYIIGTNALKQEMQKLLFPFYERY